MANNADEAVSAGTVERRSPSQETVARDADDPAYIEMVSSEFTAARFRSEAVRSASAQVILALARGQRPDLPALFRALQRDDGWFFAVYADMDRRMTKPGNRRRPRTGMGAAFRSASRDRIAIIVQLHHRWSIVGNKDQRRP
jgi:hypothetical protein